MQCFQVVIGNQTLMDRMYINQLPTYNQQTSIHKHHRYFIDRNPEMFPIILDYLRMGKVWYFAQLNSTQTINTIAYCKQLIWKRDDNKVEALQAELDFYQIEIPELLELT